MGCCFEKKKVKGTPCPRHVGVRGNEIDDALVRKAVVDGTVIVRDRVDLIRAVTVELQNEEETGHENVHKQKVIDIGVTRGERKFLLSWKGPKRGQPTANWGTKCRYAKATAGSKAAREW